MKILFVTIAVLLTACQASRIVDAEPVKMIYAEKVKHSSNWIVCVENKDGQRFSFKHNSNCWSCQTVAINPIWNRIIYKNGRSAFEPIK